MRRTAVCPTLPVTQNDGRCRLRFDCRTNRPLERKTVEFGSLNTEAQVGPAKIHTPGGETAHISQLQSDGHVL